MSAVTNKPHLSRIIIQRALAAGASLAGVVDLRALCRSPAHKTTTSTRWPSDARAALVIALEHAADTPALDWWDGNQGTPGNRELIRIAQQLQRELPQDHGILVQLIPYHDPRNELFLKDTAVLAGLGSIGRNNLLITPAYGPRVRLRALFLTAKVQASGPIDFDPCRNCPAPCLAACPQNAFPENTYRRSRCRRQMKKDESTAHNHQASTQPRGKACVKYCRACELACLVPLPTTPRSDLPPDSGLELTTNC